jgi:hypothetical protein
LKHRIEKCGVFCYVNVLEEVAVAKCNYPTLEGLPNTEVDQYGNLNLVDRRDGEGLRHRLEHVLQMPKEDFVGRRLSELLDWLRWGSNVSVMWEGTPTEILNVIERWEEANPDAEWERYIICEPVPVEWDNIWRYACKNSQMLYKVRICPNGHGRINHSIGYCEICHIDWYNVPEQEMGPRGFGTYNTVIYGYGGNSLAAAAYFTKGQTRTVPTQLVYEHELRMQPRRSA